MLIQILQAKVCLPEPFGLLKKGKDNSEQEENKGSSSQEWQSCKTALAGSIAI